MAETQVLNLWQNSKFFSTFITAIISPLGLVRQCVPTLVLTLRSLKHSSLFVFQGPSSQQSLNWLVAQWSIFLAKRSSFPAVINPPPNQNDTVHDWHIDQFSHVWPKSQFPGKQNNRTGGQGHAMPMLWKATGNDWWVSHVTVSLLLFTGIKAIFVSIQAYRFREETISGKKQRLTSLQIIHKR